MPSAPAVECADPRRGGPVASARPELARATGRSLRLGLARRRRRGPTPEMLRVLEPQAEGPRITPYLAYQLERAWAFDAARQERFARVKTEADLRALQDELRQKVLARDRRAAGREDAAQRPRHRHDPDGRLPDREARLREPARPPRDRARLRARRPGREEAGGARSPAATRRSARPTPATRRSPSASRGAGTSSSAGTRSARASAASSGTRRAGAAATTSSAASTRCSATSRRSPARASCATWCGTGSAPSTTC